MKNTVVFILLLNCLQYSNAQNIWDSIFSKCSMPDIYIPYDSSNYKYINYKYINYKENKTLFVNAADTINNNWGFQEFFIENTNLRHERYNNLTTTRFLVPPYYYSFNTDTNNRIISAEYYNFDSCLYKIINYDYFPNIIMSSFLECYYNKPDKCFSKAFHNNKLFQYNEFIPIDFLKQEPKLLKYIDNSLKALRVKTKLYDLEGIIYMDEYFDFNDFVYKTNNLGKAKNK